MRTRFLLPLILLIAGTALGQLRDFRVHRRGMLHETIYNTGEIGRAYDGGTSGSSRGIPSFEWPANSETIVDGVQYNGAYNSFGGGIYLAASRSDTSARLYSHCGAVPEPVADRYSFPQLLERRENFPLLPSGDLNPAYDPDEAEEIIVSKWATNVGITVTRTSRAWSLPDYDDFIIYEYELEYTGDVDGNPGTPASTLPLSDVLVAFAAAYCPSMFAYERTFNRWDATDYQALDQFPRFDRTRWMNYNLDRNGKPDPRYFTEWAATQRNGGGLLAPQAVGFFPLYFDTLHLAYKTETRVQVATADTGRVWDANGHLKQPFLNRMETNVLSTAKTRPYMDMAQPRKNNPYTNLATFGPDWLGRGSYNWRQSQKFGVGHILILGPYTIWPGDKFRFAIAQVAGYGAARLEETQAGLKDEGGSCGELCGEPTTYTPPYAFNPVPNWTQPITYGGILGTSFTHGSDYLATHPLPQYVNSDVVTIREVADRAIQMYTGGALVDYDSSQYWPDRMSDRGAYRVPLTVPAPVLRITNTAQAENRIEWGAHVESFSSPRLAAGFGHYEVFKSTHPLGPWTQLDSVGRGDPRYYSNGEYRLVDAATRVGESFYYSVLSVDAHGDPSGRTNVTLHTTQIGGTETLEQVFVVPNPFVVRSGFSGTTAAGGDANTKVGFYNLPKHCTIRVFSYSGQLVETIQHESELYSTEYFQVTRNNQMIASGVYFYVVETPDGSRTHGKFVIIH